MDSAPEFLTVVKTFEKWLEKHSAFSEETGEKDFIFATDGPWDIRDFVQTQYEILDQPMPGYFKEYIDIRNTFKKTVLKKRSVDKRRHNNLEGMLRILGLEFQGRPHSGIDDSR